MPAYMPADRSECYAGWWSFKTDLKAFTGLIFASWLNLLLVTAPLGIMSHFLKWGPTPTFILNFMALVPLALLLGEVTEDLAVRFGSTIGGLLNATFGNVVELILSIAALNKGLYIVIASSLAGSILSNLLLVLGESFGVVTVLATVLRCSGHLQHAVEHSQGRNIHKSIGLTCRACCHKCQHCLHVTISWQQATCNVHG